MGGGGTKLERFLPKNQHTQRKLLKVFKIQSFKSQLFLSSQKKELPNSEEKISINRLGFRSCCLIYKSFFELKYFHCFIIHFLSEWEDENY